MVTKSIVGRLLAKGAVFWLLAIVAAVSGTWIGHHLPKIPFVSSGRNYLFQTIHDFFPLEIPLNMLQIVMIDDWDYWDGHFRYRAPIDRGKLGQLLRRIAAGKPKTIGVDFDFASPHPTNPVVMDAYAQETQDLIGSLKGIALDDGVNLVLPRTLGPPSAHGYTLDRDIYAGADWGEAEKRLLFGFISLGYDQRQLPTQVALAYPPGSPPLPSFAVAMVKTVNPGRAAEVLRYENFPMASLISSRQLKPFVIPSSEVWLMSDAMLIDKFRGALVIVSGNWSSQAFQRGPPIDLHPTPAGLLPGAYIHASYVATVLQKPLRWMLSPRVTDAGEVLLSMIGVVLFTIARGVVARLATIVGLLATAIGASWLFFHVLGVYFDALVPVILVTAHLVVDELREWEFARAHGEVGTP